MSQWYTQQWNIANYSNSLTWNLLPSYLGMNPHIINHDSRWFQASGEQNGDLALVCWWSCYREHRLNHNNPTYQKKNSPKKKPWMVLWCFVDVGDCHIVEDVGTRSLGSDRQKTVESLCRLPKWPDVNKKHHYHQHNHPDDIVTKPSWFKPSSNYPLVNVYITMENHHFQWVNPL
jgi:hypothetical protein